MKVQPLNDRILVKSLEAAEKTAGGIYIPATAQEKTQEATVIAVGQSDTIKVKKNDKIIHDKYAGTNIKIDGEEYVFLKAEDVLAIIT
ncbi:10 kDa chaperonin [Spirochaetota bacterium]|nr:10 kDa chaperonin [Spirochaetota bacterium]